MFGSLKLGKFFGIDTYVHGTFWLLPLFVLLSGVAGGNLPGAAGEGPGEPSGGIPNG